MSEHKVNFSNFHVDGGRKPTMSIRGGRWSLWSGLRSRLPIGIEGVETSEDDDERATRGSSDRHHDFDISLIVLLSSFTHHHAETDQNLLRLDALTSFASVNYPHSPPPLAMPGFDRTESLRIGIIRSLAHRSLSQGPWLSARLEGICQ